MGASMIDLKFSIRAVRQARAKLRRAYRSGLDECAFGSAGGLSYITRARRGFNRAKCERTVAYKVYDPKCGEIDYDQ